MPENESVLMAAHTRLLQLFPQERAMVLKVGNMTELFTLAVCHNECYNQHNAYGSMGVEVVTYTVTYNNNAGTGTMTDANSPYVAGSTTVLANTFTRDGFEFVSWNTG